MARYEKVDEGRWAAYRKKPDPPWEWVVVVIVVLLIAASCGG